MNMAPALAGLTRRGAIGNFAAGAAMVAIGGCGRRASGREVAIANAAGGLNLTMAALMRRQRFLEDFGLDPDVTMVADGSKILGGIVGNSIDASFMSGFGQVFPANERGADIRVLGGGILLPALGLFTGKPAIHALKDLEGRTVGSGSVGALTYQLTVTLLRKFGVDVSKVRFVNIGSSADVFRAVSAGTVDAGVGQAGQIENAATYGVRLIDHGNMAEELGQFTYQGAWASARTIAERRDVLVRALAAYARLYRFVARPEAKAAFIAARRGVFPKAADVDHEAEWRFIDRYKPFATNLVLAPERLDYMQRLNIGFGVQKAMLPVDRVADMSLARDALRLLP